MFCTSTIFRPGTSAALNLDQLKPLLPNQLHDGRRFGNRGSRTGGIAASADRNRGAERGGQRGERDGI